MSEQLNEEQFPQGKLSEDDEGLLEVAIGIHEGKLIVNFGKPVYWFGLDYDGAMQLASNIIGRAQEIKPKG